MKTILQRIAAYLSLLLCVTKIQGQQSQVNFYEVIQEDSVVMFFNDDCLFTERNCAPYRRFTRIDQNGDFYQSFTDSTDHQIKGKGYYSEGFKNGRFELYHPNGNLMCTGNYKNGLEDSVWKFYYDDGKPERTLLCTETEILLTEFSDLSGNITVKNGNGYFTGKVVGNGNPRTGIIASGKVTNGKPDSTWNSVYNNILYIREKFGDGKFTEGVFYPHTNDKQKYKDKSYLNRFFPLNYLSRLEDLKLVLCLDNIKIIDPPVNIRTESYSFDMDKFRSFTKDKINRVIDEDSRNGIQYPYGESILIIGFSTNEKGEPEKFTKTTGWGLQFFDPLSEVISRFSKFFPGSKVYFHFHLNVSNSNTVGFRYYFSKSQDSQ